MSNRLVRLHHHAFVVRDQAATRHFYEDVVGLPLAATWCEVEDLGAGEMAYCHTFYELGDGSSLAFFQFADPRHVATFAPAQPPSVFDHVALAATPEQQHEIETRARDAGVAHQRIDHGYCVSLYVRDPDGLMIELTVDDPTAVAHAGRHREVAHRELERWLAGDHTSNNVYRRA